MPNPFQVRDAGNSIPTDELDAIERGSVHVLPSTPKLNALGVITSSGRETVAHRREAVANGGSSQSPPLNLPSIPSRGTSVQSVTPKSAR